jgi:hypothetical protein
VLPPSLHATRAIAVMTTTQAPRQRDTRRTYPPPEESPATFGGLPPCAPRARLPMMSR